MGDYGSIDNVKFFQSEKKVSSDGLPQYDNLLGLAKHIRSLPLPGKDLSSTPNEIARLPSVNHPNGLELHLYHPQSIPSLSSKRPAMITWHGSGFVMYALGAYGNFCRHMADRLSVTTIDADYAKSPEYPYPHPFTDCTAAIRWALKQSWCNGQLILCGFSAGGLFAITLSNPTLAAAYGLVPEEIAAIKGVVGVYASVDLDSPIENKPVYKSEFAKNIPGSILSPELLQLFTNCYFYGVDRATQCTPMASPHLANAADFTTPLILVTAQYDPLRPEVERFCKKVNEATGRNDVLFQAEGVGHGYELRVPDVDSEGFATAPGAQAKKAVYDLLCREVKKLLNPS
jgi:acetyl esterase/lipase